MAVVAAAAVLLCSCSAEQKPGLSKEFQEAVAKLREHPGRAVDESIAKELMSPEAEAAKKAESMNRMLAPAETIWLESGKSRIIEVKSPIRRVSIANPELAGLVVLGPRTVMINAKPLPPPAQGGPQIATGLGVLSSATVSTYLGRTLTPEPRTAETSLVIWQENEGYDVHSLIIADFRNQQVLLETTIAQVDRTAMEEHGIDVRAVQNDFIAAMFMGGGAGALSTIPGSPVFPLTLTPNRPTFGFVFPNQDVTALIQALQTEGLATVLAQPKITAMSGQNAVFQVGGEIPIRIATGFVAAVEFKPFGVVVNFVPRVSDDGEIMLTVSPEVSEPDFTQEVEGVPTILVRRASTSTRLRSGETLVIGGLLQKTRVEQVKGVPYLMSVPYLGYIFRQSTYADKTTELIVVVTPRLVQAIQPGQEVTLPTERGPLTYDEIQSKPQGGDGGNPTRPRIQDPPVWPH
jgi:Flp pilus assembly secretin CpaC